MSVPHKDGDVAGYHVYWTLNTNVELPGLGTTTATPLADRSGEAVVVPTSGDFDASSSHLAPGRYRLVPVDAHGNELADLPVVERVIDNARHVEALQAFIFEAIERARERVAASPKLTAALAGPSDADRETLLTLAVQRAVQQAFRQHSWLDLLGSKREEMVDTFVTTALDIVARKNAPAPGWIGLDIESFDHLVLNPSLCRVDQIQAALEGGDYDDAAIRALAHRKLGLSLPPELVPEVLVGVERMEVFLALARYASGESLVELLSSARLSSDTAGAEQTMYTAFALWQTLPKIAVRPTLVRELRGIARWRWMSARVKGLLEWFLREIQDPHLTAIYEKQHGVTQDKLADTMGQLVSHFWTATIDEIVALLPKQATALALGPVAMRSIGKPGRNEPCPCGSGRKYKRCCANNPARAMTERISRADYLHAIERRLERKHVDQLSRADLAQLDPARLETDVLINVMQRRSRCHDWPRGCQAMDQLIRRLDKDVADELIKEMLAEAARVRQHGVVREVLAKLNRRRFAADLEVELALASRSPDSLTQLEAVAMETMRQTPTVSTMDLAHAVLHTLPALGILIARGAIAAQPWGDADFLLDAVEDARDRLELPPDDAAQDIYRAVGGVRKQEENEARLEEERARLAADVETLQTRLDQASERVEALQRQVADQQRADQQRAEAESNQLTVVSLDMARERRTSREKIDTLQALIRESNEERAKLRRELANATKSKPQPQLIAHVVSRAVEDEDATEELPERTTARPPMIPRFSSRAAGAVEAAPNSIAATAMRTIGEIAAGDAAAWRAVKQAKDMPTEVLIGRIGIHYRVLFRTDANALDVIDLVTRESLMTTLKRLRST
jgi:chaperonin cofactor prefoldin